MITAELPLASKISHVCTWCCDTGKIVVPHGGSYGQHVTEECEDCEWLKSQREKARQDRAAGLPSDLACFRFDGWRSHRNTRLVFSGERLARGVDCRTQADFAHLASFYGITL